MNRKIILISILLALLAISAVNAQENATNDTVRIDEGIEDVSIEMPEENASDDEEILQANEESIEAIGSSDDTKHYGYWVLSANMYDLDLDDLSSKGVTDIFLNFKSYEKYGKDNLEAWISNANEKGIHTHIWTQIFWTSKTGWIKPLVNGTLNTDFFNQKTEELTMYASIKGLSGIHMDYLRYSGSSKYNNAAWQNPGGMEAISSFVKQATESIRAINPNLIISAAIMPEFSALGRVYGVDYDVISKCLDVIVPMVYAGNYHQNRDWIMSTTEKFVSNSKGAEIWTGLQAYNNDEDLALLPLDKMNGDIYAALKGGANGAIIFRFGVSENINFNEASISEIKIKAKSGSFIVTRGGNYYVTVVDSYGYPMKSEKVQFFLNGKKIASVLTNDGGVAKLSLKFKILKSAKIGKNKLVIKLANGKSKTVYVYVKKDTTKLKISKSKRKIKIKLKDSKNKAIKKAKIIVKYNGKKYKVKTNSKGTATFKFNKRGKFKVLIKFYGNKYYKGKSKKIKMNIK